jgi:hypothetical protein
MAAGPNDLVRVAAGSLTQVQHWHELLGAAGIASRVVGDDLAAGLGSALPGSVELWARRADAAAAGAAIVGAAGHRRREPESHPAPPHGHPESDPGPDRSLGPRHGAPPHRPLHF